MKNKKNNLISFYFLFRNVEEMVEMTSAEIKEMDLKYNLHSWSKQGNLNPMVITKAEGIYLWDSDGKRYMDMSSELVNSNVGHGNKEIIAAIKEQADKFCFLSPAFALEPRSKLAKMVIDRMPDNMGKVFFTNGGADANENAITIDFASEEDATKFYITKLREQVIYENPETIAAIVMETITGSNGVIIPPKGYLEGVRKICDEFGIMMICDEVMAGWCRTGKMFAFENFNVKPDIVSFAKGITCGYVQLGGVAVSKKIADFFNDHVLQCGLTYSGHPLACAAGVACLHYYDEAHILDNVNTVGKVLGELEEELKDKHACVGDVRYIGLWSAIELVKDKTTKEPLVPFGKDPEGTMPKIIKMLIDRGFFTYSHENTIMVAPPLIITEEQIREAMAIMDDVLSEVDKMI